MGKKGMREIHTGRGEGKRCAYHINDEIPMVFHWNYVLRKTVELKREK